MAAREQCLVSVQWGSGFHYFITPKPVAYEEATAIAEGHARNLKRHLATRGALPTMRVLCVVTETNITREKPA